jgi:hypothetical protein
VFVEVFVRSQKKWIKDQPTAGLLHYIVNF